MSLRRKAVYTIDFELYTHSSSKLLHKSVPAIFPIRTYSVSVAIL